MRDEDFIYLGILLKTHGVKGELILKSELQNFDYEILEPVFFEINKKRVPFFISEIRDKSSESFIISFDEINTEEKAREYAGCFVYIYSKDYPQFKHASKKPDIQDIIGFNVTDQNFGIIGKIIAYENIPGNPLIIVEYKTREIFIPFQDKMIQSIDTIQKTVTTSLPDGFLSL